MLIWVLVIVLVVVLVAFLLMKSKKKGKGPSGGSPQMPEGPSIQPKSDDFSAGQQ